MADLPALRRTSPFDLERGWNGLRDLAGEVEWAKATRVAPDDYVAAAASAGRAPVGDLTPADTERLLRDLAARRPAHANAVTCLRTAAVAALVPHDDRPVDAQSIGIRVPHARGRTETVCEQKRHTRRLRVVHLEGQRDPVFALQSVHCITYDPDWMAGYKA